MADYVTIISYYVTIITVITDICIMLIMSLSLYPPIDVHELPRCALICTHLEKHVLEQLTMIYWHVQ